MPHLLVGDLATLAHSAVAYLPLLVPEGVVSPPRGCGGCGRRRWGGCALPPPPRTAAPARSVGGSVLNDTQHLSYMTHA